MFTVRHMSQGPGNLSNSFHAGVVNVASYRQIRGAWGHMSPKPLKSVFSLDVLKSVILCPLKESECYVMWLCVIFNTPLHLPIRQEGGQDSRELKIQI